MRVDGMELIEDYPSRIAAMLLQDEIDVGLVPVAILPKLAHYEIISDYCISADDEVASVCLFSEVPVHEIKKVLLDYQSRTSVALAKILLRDYWKIAVEFEEATADFRAHIQGTTAAIVIGDRAFEQRRQSTYIYDLAAAWKAFTGLPFVFAAWVANKPLPQSFVVQFNAANKFGVDNIDAVLEETNYVLYDLEKYFTRNINYYLTSDKRKGLQKFLSLIS